MENLHVFLWGFGEEGMVERFLAWEILQCGASCILANDHAELKQTGKGVHWLEGRFLLCEADISMHIHANLGVLSFA